MLSHDIRKIAGQVIDNCILTIQMITSEIRKSDLCMVVDDAQVCSLCLNCRTVAVRQYSSIEIMLCDVCVRITTREDATTYIHYPYFLDSHLKQLRSTLLTDRNNAKRIIAYMLIIDEIEEHKSTGNEPCSICNAGNAAVLVAWYENKHEENEDLHYRCVCDTCKTEIYDLGGLLCKPSLAYLMSNLPSDVQKIISSYSLELARADAIMAITPVSGA